MFGCSRAHVTGEKSETTNATKLYCEVRRKNVKQEHKVEGPSAALLIVLVCVIISMYSFHFIGELHTILLICFMDHDGNSAQIWKCSMLTSLTCSPHCLLVGWK